MLAHDAARIVSLDNGYVYVAATRLSLHRSAHDWALVLEIFGYSPRAGLPALYVSTFGTGIRGRQRREDFATERASLDEVLATSGEQRTNVPLDAERLLQLDDWAKNERPSDGRRPRDALGQLASNFTPGAGGATGPAGHGSGARCPTGRANATRARVRSTSRCASAADYPRCAKPCSSASCASAFVRPTARRRVATCFESSTSRCKTITFI